MGDRKREKRERIKNGKAEEKEERMKGVFEIFTPVHAPRTTEYKDVGIHLTDEKTRA